MAAGPCLLVEVPGATLLTPSILCNTHVGRPLQVLQASAVCKRWQRITLERNQIERSSATGTQMHMQEQNHTYTRALVHERDTVMCAHLHTHMHTYLHTYLHTYVHTHTRTYRDCITLHYHTTLHCIALYYITLPCSSINILLRYTTLDCLLAT